MKSDDRRRQAANDRAVLAAYGLRPDATEREIVAHLFSIYAKAAKKEHCARACPRPGLRPKGTIRQAAARDEI